MAITVLFGNYGSGKTEIALNLALRAAAQGPSLLADLDIVNPYFRASEQRVLLESHGVELLAPTFAGRLDIPALPAEMQRLLTFQGSVTVDLGGDTGAVALGRFAPEIRQNARCLMVVNPNRPFSGTLEELLAALAKMEGLMRLRATGIIINSHLGLENTQDIFLQGLQTGEAFAAAASLPVAHVAGLPAFLPALPEKYHNIFLPLTLYTKPDWL